MRYVIPEGGAWLHVAPGGTQFARLPAGHALRVMRTEDGTIVRKGDFVAVQPVDAQGRTNGEPGWMSGSVLKPKGDVMTFLFGDLQAGPAGRAMLNRECSFKFNGCGYSAQEAMPALPAPIGSAKNYAIRSHPNALVNHGWREVTGEDYRPDDVVVWINARDGHVGFVVMGSDRRPRVVSNYEGRLRVTGFDIAGGRYRVYRR